MYKYTYNLYNIYGHACSNNFTKGRCNRKYLRWVLKLGFRESLKIVCKPFLWKE